MIMAAQDEAKRLGSGFVGSEHLLLGMLREGEPIVFKTLEYFRVGPEVIKEMIEEAAPGGTGTVSGPEVPFNAQAKKVIELAWEEARGLGHSYVGVEHLFLGLLRESSGITGKVLGEVGITASSARGPDRFASGRSSCLSEKSAAPQPDADARFLRAGPDSSGLGQEIGPGHRPGQGDRARDPDPFPPQERTIRC